MQEAGLYDDAKAREETLRVKEDAVLWLENHYENENE